VDFSTIFGLLVSAAIFVGSIIVSTQDSSVYYNTLGVVIVFGGTSASMIVAFPMSRLLRIIRYTFVIFVRSSENLNVHIGRIIDISRQVAVSNAFESVKTSKRDHPFLSDVLELLVNNYTAERVENISTLAIINQKKREIADINIFKLLAKIAPAFGMLGTLIGLIVLLQNMGGAESAKTLGPAMAVALTTTFYGVVLANLVFNPLAENLLRRTDEQVLIRSMLLEGLIMIKKGDPARVIHKTLSTYLPPKKRVDFKGIEKFIRAGK